jgi:hypothetical protein
LEVPTVKTLKIDLTFNDDGVTQTKQCADFVRKKIAENCFLKPLA